MNFVPRGKKFQPRIPREQLLELTTQELQEKGVEHNSQARLMNEISHEIYSTTEPIFVQLRGRAFVRNTEPWSRVYSLVINYLREYEMNNTLETIETELATARTIKHNKAVDSSDAFDKILEFSGKRRKISFKQRVKEWKEEDEKLNPPPAFVRPTMREMKQANSNTQHVQLPKKTVSHVNTKLANTYSSSSSKESKEKAASSKENSNATKENASVSFKQQQTAPKQTQEQTKPKQETPKQTKTSNAMQKPKEEEKKETRPTKLESIPESDDFEDSFGDNSKNSSANKSSESDKSSSDIEEIPTTPIPPRKEAPKPKDPEPEPEQEKSVEFETIDEEDEKPIPLQKQRPTTFAPPKNEETTKVSNKKALLDFDEPEDIAIDFDSDDGDDFITESSAVTNEKSNVNNSQFDSFADDSTVKDEKSKVSVQFDSFAKDSFIDETSTVKGESSKQTFDDFEESSKVDVQQNSASNSGSDVEIIEDSSKADVVQQSSSNEFVEIDDWDD